MVPPLPPSPGAAAPRTHAVVLPDLAALRRTLQQTWPAASVRPLGPFMLRDGAGGGKRVSAATLAGPTFAAADLDRAEAAMRAAGQMPLFSLTKAGQTRAPDLGAEFALDQALEARGYARVDPTVLMVAHLSGPLPAPAHPVYALWPPLAVQAQIWDEEGTTAPRRAVMARTSGARITLLGRLGDRPAGTGFVAIGENPDCAMLHALAVRPTLRRAGLGRAMVVRAMHWAHEAGAQWLALAVTEANAPARALYASMGFLEAGAYHYRLAPEISGGPA